MAMINLLALEPHKVSKDLGGYLTYIYGAAKSGKTTLGSKMPRPIILAAEKGYNALPGVIAQDITTWGEMRQVYRELKKPEVRERFDSVIVDTIDIMSDLCQKYVCTQNNISSLSELPYGNGWVLFKNEFSEVFRGLTQLGYAVLFIGHEKEQAIGDDDNKKLIIRPALTATTRSIIVGMCDIIGYAHQKGANQMSVLTLRSANDTIVCGSRFKYMPTEITLGYDNLVKALSDAIDKEAEETNGQFVTTERNQAQINITTYDYDKLMREFSEISNALVEKDDAFYKPRITQVIDKIFGKGKKIADATLEQAELIYLVIEEIKATLM